MTTRKRPPKVYAAYNRKRSKNRTARILRVYAQLLASRPLGLLLHEVAAAFGVKNGTIRGDFDAIREAGGVISVEQGAAGWWCTLETEVQP